MSERADAQWEQVYMETAPRLWRSLVGFTADVDVANDAMSEAFAQGIRRGTDVRDPAAWVWRAAFRIAAGEMKERRAAAASAAPVLELAGDPQEVTLVETERLLGALRQLSPSQRASIVLHHYAGFSVREIAGIIDSTGPAVRVHLSRGRARLRALLEDSDA